MESSILENNSISICDFRLIFAIVIIIIFIFIFCNNNVKNEVENMTTNVVTLYDHCNYQGRSLELGVGTYDYSFINSRGFNDTVSSIKVPFGLKAVAFEHNPYQGSQWTFASDNPCIRNLGANDTISSIIISKV